jgi:ketosteroid isomerase-like protein
MWASILSSRPETTKLRRENASQITESPLFSLIWCCVLGKLSLHSFEIYSNSPFISSEGPTMAETLAQKILALEHAALTRWGNGDPSGFLDITAKDVVYFDPFLERRINGLAELTRNYEELRGKIHVDHFELIDPVVQLTESMAVLTFNYTSTTKAIVSQWNCTEVYRREPDGEWRIIQTHWSFVKPLG